MTATIASSVTSRPDSARCVSSGDALDGVALAARVSWLLDLIAVSERRLLDECWSPAVFDRLHSGVDDRGRRLPAAAAVVAARCGWLPRFPDGVYVPSRVSRVVAAHVVSALRTSAFRDRVIAAELRGSTGGASPAFSRNVHRQIGAWVVRNPGRRPEDLRITDLQEPPAVSRRARLGAVDGQLAAFTATSSTSVVMRVKLPTVPQPHGRADWQWVELTMPVPGHLRQRPITGWHLPDVTVDDRGVLLRLAFEETAPITPDPAEAQAAVGVDWSPKDLLVSVVVTGDARAGELSSDLRGRRFEDRGLTVKLGRLQRHGQHLHAKAARIEQLAAGADPATRERLLGKAAALTAEALHCGRKRTRINRDLAFLAAQHAVTVARLCGATVIAVEDLATLEARGLGPRVNNTIAQSARRKTLEALTHTAARNGIAVVETAARGTSRNCPACDRPVTRPGGYHSAVCAPCRMSVNRDDVGAANTGKRVLAAGAQTRKQRDTRRLRTTTVQHTPVKRSRDKTTPTPPRARRKRVRHSLQPARVARTAASARDTVQPRPVATTGRGTRASTSNSNRLTPSRVSASDRGT